MILISKEPTENITRLGVYRWWYQGGRTFNDPFIFKSIVSSKRKWDVGYAIPALLVYELGLG